MNSVKHVAIIGGGAAGMMTVATLLEKGFSGIITLFERNGELGTKVRISGGGRCNVTTGITDVRTLVREKYPRGGMFLRSALRAHGPSEIRAWFEAHGVPLKEECDRRVFPVSDCGADVVRVFEKLFRASNVCVRFSTVVKDIVHMSDGKFIVTSLPQRSEKVTEVFDAVVLTTGGNAYAHTGSRGDGYAFARACGHTITSLGPSLNSFLTKQQWTKELSGTSFPNAEIVIMRADGARIRQNGPVLLTHFGVSGPVVFAVAAYVAHRAIDAKHPLDVTLRIDADCDFSVWDSALRTVSSKKSVEKVLRQRVTMRFAQAVVRQCGIKLGKKCTELSQSERRSIAHMLGDGFTLRVVARRAGDEFVTAGGIARSEIDAKTGMSRIVPNLYFAGEIIDVDGVTGGFNLTASWAMGHIVGRALAKNKLL